MSTLHIYTDGSYDTSKDVGGWSIVSEHFIIHDYKYHTSSIEMELYAIWMAIEFSREYDRVHIHTDNQEVIDIFTSKCYMWEQTGWKWINFDTNGDGFVERVIYNKDLIMKIFNEIKSAEGKFIFHKVKAHSGNYCNDLADKYAKNSYKFKKWMK